MISAIDLILPITIPHGVVPARFKMLERTFDLELRRRIGSVGGGGGGAATMWILIGLIVLVALVGAVILIVRWMTNWPG